VTALRIRAIRQLWDQIAGQGGQSNAGSLGSPIIATPTFSLNARPQSPQVSKSHPAPQGTDQQRKNTKGRNHAIPALSMNSLIFPLTRPYARATKPVAWTAASSDPRSS